jgi:DNA-binding response OmpR family regulator
MYKEIQIVMRVRGHTINELPLSVRGEGNAMRVGPEGHQFEVKLKVRPRPQVANVLFLLARRVNRIVSKEELCETLRLPQEAVAIHITRLRQTLSDDWTVEVKPNVGYRLIDLRGK